MRLVGLQLEAWMVRLDLAGDESEALLQPIELAFRDIDLRAPGGGLELEAVHEQLLASGEARILDGRIAGLERRDGLGWRGRRGYNFRVIRWLGWRGLFLCMERGEDQEEDEGEG